MEFPCYSKIYCYNCRPQFLTSGVNYSFEKSSFWGMDMGWNECSSRHFPNKLWWRHQIETFSALLTLCEGNSPVTGEFPAQRPVTRSFDVSCDLHLNKGLSKKSWGWWLETLSSSLWRHFNDALFEQTFRTRKTFEPICQYLGCCKIYWNVLKCWESAAQIVLKYFCLILFLEFTI